MDRLGATPVDPPEVEDMLVVLTDSGSLAAMVGPLDDEA